MILTLLVLLYIGWETYKGYQTGFTRRIVNLVFAAIVLMVAIFGQNILGNVLYQHFAGQASTSSQAMDLMIYRFIAFFIIMFIGRLLVKFLKKGLPAESKKEDFGTVLNRVLGALINLLAAYFVVYVILSMLNAMQLNWFIQQTAESPLLHAIVYNTPGLSNDVFNNIFGISRTLS